MSQNPNAPSEIPGSLIEQIGGLPKEKQAAIRLLIQNIDLFEKMMENDSEFDHILQKYAERASRKKRSITCFRRCSFTDRKKGCGKRKKKRKTKPPKRNRPQKTPCHAGVFCFSVHFYTTRGPKNTGSRHRGRLFRRRRYAPAPSGRQAFSYVSMPACADADGR